MPGEAKTDKFTEILSNPDVLAAAGDIETALLRLELEGEHPRAMLAMAIALIMETNVRCNELEDRLARHEAVMKHRRCDPLQGVN